MSALARAILKNAIGLALFAVLTAGLIAITQYVTADKIAEQKRLAQASALLEVVPPEQRDNDLLDASFTIAPNDKLQLSEPATGYRAYKDGQVTGVILPAVAPNGYSGPIRLLVGIDRDGTILGVRVVEHHETPGLGDQVEIKKSNWVYEFNGRSLSNPEPKNWQVAKRGGAFDQFTGATITPNAVVRAVYRTLRYFKQHREALLSEQAQPETRKRKRQGAA
ncbi:electron transport complex subunit RsxG [Marinobacteraceae bacterium S3BR75-40.1]